MGLGGRQAGTMLAEDPGRASGNLTKDTTEIAYVLITDVVSNCSYVFIGQEQD
jgi:hypothetical protein